MGGRQIKALVELAVAALSAEPESGCQEAVADVLLSVLEADVITLNCVQPGCGRAQVPIVGPAWARSATPHPDVVGPVLAAHPLVRHYAATGATEPLSVTDVVPSSVWRHSAARSLVHELLGVHEQLAVRVTAPEGEVRAWVAMRESGAFAPGTRALAAQLRPILVAVEAQQEVLHRLAARTSGIDIRRGSNLAGLTPREMAVLTLLGDELTAVAIGRRLSISPRTVTTHLQRIYRKLDVTDRLTAVLQARDLGLLPGMSAPRESDGPVE